MSTFQKKPNLSVFELLKAQMTEAAKVKVIKPNNTIKISSHLMTDLSEKLQRISTCSMVYMGHYESFDIVLLCTCRQTHRHTDTLRYRKMFESFVAILSVVRDSFQVF